MEATDGQVKGSLLNYIDYCKTQFGKRQLKRWLMAPLLDVDKIESRLDAIDDLLANQHETDELRAKLSKLPDLEKLLAKIFTYSIKHKVKAIYFEDVSLIKMKEFRTLLKCFKGLNDTLGGLLRLNQQGKLRSERLKTLLTIRADEDEDNESGGLMPDGVEGIIQEFDQLIVWKKVAGGANAVEIPEP